MHMRYVLPLLAVACLGLYLLHARQETFLPYTPVTFSPYLTLMGEPAHRPLFDFVEARVEGLRLVDLADEHMAAGDYDDAIVSLEQAVHTFSFVDDLYERLAHAYGMTGQWRLAREAMEGDLIYNAFAVPRPWPAEDGDAVPEMTDITQSAGLGDCRHQATGMLDNVSPGVAVFDLDGDGHPDVICLAGAHGPTRVFRGSADGFVPVFDTGLEEDLASQGVLVADFTHNGLPDVVITAIGESRLYLNKGGLRFRPISLPLPEMWASAAAAADFTGNGHVDLVVGGWLGYEIWSGFGRPGYRIGPYEKTDAASRAARLLPNPDAPLHLLNVSVRHGVPLKLLEGDGTGQFKDVTEASGVSVSATTLNLELIDLTGNGHLDLVVINDSMPSRLFLGQGDGRFEEVTHAARFADLRAGMGLAIADFNGNGHWDFFKTHFQGEMNGLFMSDGLDGGVPRYRDAALLKGVGAPSLPYVGWAAFAWDVDANGREGLLVINGHLRNTPQPMQLFKNTGQEFTDVSVSLSGDASRPIRGRGAALFDMDGDGFDDILVVQNNGSAQLLKTSPNHANHWIRVRVQLPDVDALGGTVILVDSLGRRHMRPVRTGSAYFSAQPREYYFGLGKAYPVEIIWNGRTDSFRCDQVSVESIVTLTADGCQ